jgi:hypothetical protein
MPQTSVRAVDALARPSLAARDMSIATAGQREVSFRRVSEPDTAIKRLRHGL